VRLKPVHAVPLLAAGVALGAWLLISPSRHAELGLDARGAAGSPVRLVGRFDMRDPAGPRFAWAGSAIVVAFEGTGIDLTLDDSGTNAFGVAVDGTAPTVLVTMQHVHTYALASNLKEGRHEVVVTKRTEASAGVVRYLGVSPHGGSLVAAAAPPARQIEYVGDSIACGYGVLCTGAEPADAAPPGDTPRTEDETIAFAALAAAGVHAQATVIAYSGKGVYRDYTGSTTDPMPALFGRALPDDPTSAWTFGAQPDVVVVELGTNDFALGDPGPPFREAYGAFLRDLRRRYPDAYVVCTLSPMMSDYGRAGGGPRTLAGRAIEGAVDERKGSGDARIAYLAFDEQDARDGFGCEAHPSPKTQRVMAAKLVGALQRLVGWYPEASAPQDSAPAEASLPPLSSDPPIVPLAVDGFPEAVISVPLGATSPRPVVVATHGVWDFPEGLCDDQRWIFRDAAWVVCPRGRPLPDKTFRYDGVDALRREIDADVRALDARYPGYVDDRAILYTGFSLGAILGVGVITREPARFPRAVLIEGGEDRWTPALAARYAREGGQRVLFACGLRGRVPAARQAASMLERAGVPARVVLGKLPDAGQFIHWYNGPIADETRAAEPWLFESDPRWGVSDDAGSK
jgi:lysophospholipase L1-like esterase